ncbi:UNVERIFIED_CONTAM: hypothetical protein Slati_3078600 [Sesamum latifolium]|uniref:DUF4283 domain-containing protein n=1 Tax=Sesamum latifolium TaxID=2727402 RepID=A0AAW2UVP5_9LAMI
MDSWVALHSLKQRWIEKFGDGAASTPVGGLKLGRSPTENLAVISNPVSPVAESFEPPPRVFEGPADLTMEAGFSPAESMSPTRPIVGEGGLPPGSRSSVATLNESIPAAATNPSTNIYIGNVPLTTGSNSTDKIAAAFHNSSHKMLSFIPPTLQNGKVIVWPSLKVIRDGSQRWSTTVVGYFLGRRPYFHHLNDYVRFVWPMVREVTATSNGFFFFQFKTTAAMEEHTQVPVWIKLRHLPVELWTNEGLSIVTSGIGRPLYSDAITRACTRLDFARVCIMLDISSKLPKHIVIMVPQEDGGEKACKVNVEYEWLPPKCNTCMSLGHSTKGCPTMKPKQPPVSGLCSEINDDRTGASETSA